MQRATDTDQRQRLAALTKLFVTFDAEPSQQRIAAYVEATARMPVQWLVRGVDSILGTFKGRGAPKPAEVLEAANGARRAAETWAPPDRRALAAGPRGGGFAAGVAAVLDSGAPALVSRAREIREHGELVPPGFIGRLLSYFAAAYQLGIHYPVDRQAQATFEQALLAWGDQGHDVDWWFASAAHRFDLDALEPRCSCGAQMSRARGAA